ncbi:MAG TPA: hypothetical protein VHX15_15960 [Frankiaceae bacterium]|jgi:hypothetical protein|nr:hypothetical protein [Frankiaceae bacterium]
MAEDPLPNEPSETYVIRPAALPDLRFDFPFPRVLPEDPEEARALVLRTLWPQFINQYLPGHHGLADVPAAQRPLVEVMRNDDGENESTGRHIGGLHESLLSADPSGREGADLFS